MNILYINCCIRDKESRTNYIASNFIKKLLNKYNNAKLTEIKLYEINLSPLLYSDIKFRDELISKNDLNNDYFKLANQFNNADKIIIAAPYWDLSFPSLLKVYFEHICVNNINFKYINDKSIGLAKYSSLIYITSAGGKIDINDLDYINKIHKFLGNDKAKIYYSISNLFDVLNKNEIDKNINNTINDFDNILKEF